MPDVVSVALEMLDLVHGVVVVDTDEHIVCPAYHPLLARHEFGRPHCKTGRSSGAKGIRCVMHHTWVIRV